jgi:hypothetical protein
MTFPWFALILNCVLLAVAIFVCNTLNVGRRGPLLNGAMIFLAFCFLAMILDLALTFVFASATTTDRERYIDLSSFSSFGERLIAYAIPGAVALIKALRFRGRQPQPKRGVMIQTSEYTQSELPT